MASQFPISAPQLGAFIYRQQSGLAEGGTLSYTVLRKNEAGEMKEVELSAPVKKVELTRKHLLKFAENATPEQLTLREAWLEP
ncbi:MAG: hypothetical protein HC859_04185 [Bacteroidia bacterium]|nr:hypothetical protein [Bacteroidia bacterium]